MLMFLLKNESSIGGNTIFSENNIIEINPIPSVVKEEQESPGPAPVVKPDNKNKKNGFYTLPEENSS